MECLALACGPLRSEVAAALLGPNHQELMTQLTAMRLAKVQRGADGEIVITLLSDDNFFGLQRTLLLRFALVED